MINASLLRDHFTPAAAHTCGYRKHGNNEYTYVRDELWKSHNGSRRCSRPSYYRGGIIICIEYTRRITCERIVTSRYTVHYCSGTVRVRVRCNACILRCAECSSSRQNGSKDRKSRSQAGRGSTWPCSKRGYNTRPPAISLAAIIIQYVTVLYTRACTSQLCRRIWLFLDSERCDVLPSPRRCTCTRFRPEGVPRLSPRDVFDRKRCPIDDDALLT